MAELVIDEWLWADLAGDFLIMILVPQISFWKTMLSSPKNHLMS